MIPTMQGFRWIGGDLLSLFELLREAMPTLHGLSLEVSKYECLDGEVELHGFYHTANGCFSFEGIEELFNAYKRGQILFQKFEGWENRVKRERREADLNAIN